MGILRNRESIVGVPTDAEAVTAERGRNINNNERSWGTKLGLGITALAAAGVLVLGSSVHEGSLARAKADEVVLFCGAGDPACNVENDLRAKGYIAPEDSVHRVPGPYEIAPFVPMGAPHSARQSTDIAVANANGMLPNITPAPGEDLTFMGYSLGTIPSSVVANQYAVNGQLPEGVRNVIVNGPPTPEGVFQNEVVKMFDPIVQMIDVPTEVIAPGGTDAYGHTGDVWTYSKDDGLMELAQKGINTFFGPVHAPQDINGQAEKWTGPEGINYTEFTGPAVGGAPGGITMGNPMPAPAPEARPAPNSENFTAVSREWKERHGMELVGDDSNSNRPTTDNLPKSTYGNHSRQINIDREDGKKTRVTGSYSARFEPPVRAGMYGNRDK